MILIDTDPHVVWHLHKALVEHRTWCRTNGLPVPDVIGRLLEETHAARNGQQRPTLPLPAGVLHDSARGDDSALLGPADAAAWLTVSTRTLRRLVAEGRLPVVRIGRTVRFKRSDLDQFTRSTS
jgi:excisionase family DNA binding protein